MNIKKGDHVSVARPIIRVEGPYADADETGEVIRVFRPSSTRGREKKLWHAQVRMDGSNQLKTFRLTSLTKTKNLE